MSKLSDQTRSEIVDYLFDVLRDSMFGDGLEHEYIKHGVSFKGLNNMTDQELVEEYEMYMDSEDDELKVKAKAELAIHNVVLS